MRYSIFVAAVSSVLLVFAANAVLAQTAAPMSKRALRQQDRAECSKQVDRHQANAFLECIAAREAARKQAASAVKAAKKAECKKQADEHKLGFARRLHFMVKCMRA